MEERNFKFVCSHCGQPLEAESDMVGMILDCPKCGLALTVPKIGDSVSGDTEADEFRDFAAPEGGTNARCPGKPRITVLKGRTSLFDKCKKGLRAVGVGIVVLLLFAGVAVIEAIVGEENPKTAGMTGKKVDNKSKAVLSSIECLLNYVDLPNERRLQVLSKSMESCPKDFRDAVTEYLISASKTVDDMISDRERNEMVAGSAALGLLFGAINQNDPGGGVSAGLKLGELISEEVKKKAAVKLDQEIEGKRNQLLDVAQKYGIDPIKLENALLGRVR